MHREFVQCIHSELMMMVMHLLPIPIPSFSAQSFAPARHGLFPAHQEANNEEDTAEGGQSTSTHPLSRVVVLGAMVLSFGFNALPAAGASSPELGFVVPSQPPVCMSSRHLLQTGQRFSSRHVHTESPEKRRLQTQLAPTESSPQKCERMDMRLGRQNTAGSHRQASIGGVSATMDYEHIVQEHESDDQMKRGMFTSDAWMGMMRLQRYDELLRSVQEKEKLCKECTRNRRLMEQVWQTVSNEYFDQYGSFSQTEWVGDLLQCLEEAGGLLYSKAETYKTVKQLVARLGDRYSSFLTPEEYRFALHRPIQSELKYLVYQYTGVGMEIGRRHPKGGFEIVAPFAGSPAEEGGILGGERLLFVDGFPVDQLTRDEAVTLLRGPIGSMVELEIVTQDPEALPQKLILERRSLPLPPLKMRMIDAGHGNLVAYIRLHYFSHDATKKMASAIREGESLGVDGYILDLRNNPGGVFEEAIAMAALWLDCKGCNITETVRSSADNLDDFTYVAGNLPDTVFMRHPGVLTHAPVVTICNRNSASASEVLLGALQDNGRTVVLGERTFGKGVVQYFFPMDDGSGLKLTVAKYLTPRRYDISKQGGLLPDKYCRDYPHAGGAGDECIQAAIQDLLNVEPKQAQLSSPPPMPYRWLPLRDAHFRQYGSY